ncbi:MAG: hypothetical protein OES09_03235 [Gammaproteobacteria bacterium]|nr:hypothetical protein [Gammaproteobacteria bacterium]
MKDKQTQQMREKSTEVSREETKKDWQRPKLEFVRPKLTKHGAVKELTGGFFGTFTPPRP